MKRKLTTVIFFFFALSVYGQSRGGVSLDDAIYNSALQIQEGLENGSKIVVYQFQSQNAKISDYVLNELFNLLVNSRKFTVLDRSAQDVVNAELNYQYNTSAGMISDESLADLTRRIGAQAIITGSLDDVGNEYRFRIRVIGTETVAAIISYAVSVNKNDRRIAAFSSNPPGIGQNILTGATNILFGLGSYLEDDILGGITISAGYALAAGLFIIEATALDWDSPAVGVPATIGFAVAGVTFVYGFARPFIYNRSPNLAVIMDNTRPEIVPVSDRYTGNGNLGFRLSYTVKLR